MGGKGIRRREKNYRAAHGGQPRFPPPPNPSQVDALPSKLRQLISLSSRLHGNNESDEPAKPNTDGKRKRPDGGSEKSEKKRSPVASGVASGKDDDDDDDDDESKLLTSQNQNGGDEKKKKKKKRKEVKDLRFDTEMTKKSGKRRERKKKYLEAKKKKHKKSGTAEDSDFPGCEKIQFGDVVQAPPKLVNIPKQRNMLDASKERLRLQAIDAYRNKKGWTSRLGIQLPTATTTTPTL